MSSYWDEVQRESLLQEAREATAPERLRELSREHPDVVAAVAHNPLSPLDVLRTLAQRPELPILIALLQNESLEEEAFEPLTQHPSRALARLLASSHRTPPYLLERLSQSDNREVLVALSKNLRTPPEALERLSNHPRREIFTAAQRNPSNPLYVDGDPARRWSRGDLPESYAALACAPRLIIAQMLESSDSSQRRMALLAPRLTEGQRQLLARDAAPEIRAALARSLSEADALVELLSVDPSPLVRATLALNNSLTPSRRQQLAQTLPPPQAPERDQLLSLEEQLRQAFGRKTMQQRESQRLGLVMAGAGALTLLAALFVQVPLSWLIIAASLLILGSLLAIFP